MKRVLTTVAALAAAVSMSGNALASAPAIHHVLTATTVAARAKTFLNRTTFAVPNPSIVVSVNCSPQAFPGVTGQAFLCYAHLGYRSGQSTVQSNGSPWQVSVVKNGNLKYTPLTVGCLPPHVCDPSLDVGGPLTPG